MTFTHGWRLQLNPDIESSIFFVAAGATVFNASHIFNSFSSAGTRNLQKLFNLEATKLLIICNIIVSSSRLLPDLQGNNMRSSFLARTGRADAWVIFVSTSTRLSKSGCVRGVSSPWPWIKTICSTYDTYFHTSQSDWCIAILSGQEACWHPNRAMCPAIIVDRTIRMLGHTAAGLFPATSDGLGKPSQTLLHKIDWWEDQQVSIVLRNSHFMHNYASSSVLLVSVAATTSFEKWWKELSAALLLH